MHIYIVMQYYFPRYRKMSKDTSNQKLTSSATEPLSTLLADHAYFKEVFGGPGMPSRVERLLARERADEASQCAKELFTRLAQHEALEEIVVHPLYPQFLGAEGEQILNIVTEEDEKAKVLVDKLERIDLNTNVDEFFTLFNKLKVEALAHATKEEEEFFPVLLAKLSESDRDTLAHDIDAWRESGILPTHPHPQGPSRPNLARVAHPFAGVLDKAWDALTGAQNRASDASVNLSSAR